MEILENEEIGELEAVEEIQQEREVTKVELPAKFKGKSYDELARTIVNQELMINRQSNEVGEVRKLADELLKSQFSNAPKVEPKEKVDFFENPDQATDDRIANHPDVVAARMSSQRSNQALAQQEFYRLNPDANAILSDPEFTAYCNANPERASQHKRAANYDVGAANELLGNYRLMKSAKQTQSNEIGQAERSRSIKSVSVDSGGSGESGKKIYSSAALRLLQMRDPRKYEAMQDEILSAYSENRVR